MRKRPSIAYVVLWTSGPDPRSRGYQASTHGTGAHSSLRGHFYCYKLDPSVLQQYLQTQLPAPPHLTVVLTGHRPSAEQLNRLWSVEPAYVRQAFDFLHAHSRPYLSVRFNDNAMPAQSAFTVDLTTTGTHRRCASGLHTRVAHDRPWPCASCCASRLIVRSGCRPR